MRFDPRVFLCTVLAFVSLCWSSAAGEEKPLVLAHYMPWYESKEISGNWGWHWTMNHFDPDIVNWDGKPQAATHDPPLIGLYDSSDPAVLECHVLMMQFAGIDGVIFDWYGIEDCHDYSMIHKNVAAMIPYLEKAGLKFAVCYEDQSIREIAKAKKLSEQEAIETGQKVMTWLKQNWFQHPNYLELDGAKVLPVFGPQYFSAEQWQQVIEPIKADTKIYTLPHLGDENLMAWPPVTGGTWVHTPVWQGKLKTIYDRPNADKMATVFPGFHDIYKQAGVQESHGRIHPRDGQTFVDTLDMALDSAAPLIQIATWNDFGEGTVIEPTQRNGYRYLEELRDRIDTKDNYSNQDLRLPVALYQLRKRGGSDKQANSIADLLFKNQLEAAKQQLVQAKQQLVKKPVAGKSKYKLIRDIPYREGDDLDEYQKNRCKLDIYYPSGHKPYATVIWFHGGGIQNGNKSIPLPLENKGIAVVAANYRLHPKVNQPTYIEDAAAAVAWVVKNIHRYGAGRKDAVFVSGHSAGGYLSSMVGLDKQYLAKYDVDADQLAGLIPFSGHTITHFTVRKERGIDGKQPVIDNLAPLFHMRKDCSPMLLITGDREMELMARYEENAYFWRMMQDIGHPDCELRELEGFDHGKMPEPGFPLMLQFIDKHSKLNITNN